MDDTMDMENNNDHNQEENSQSNKEAKIETCYTCGKEIDMNSDEGAH